MVVIIWENARAISLSPLWFTIRRNKQRYKAVLEIRYITAFTGPGTYKALALKTFIVQNFLCVIFTNFVTFAIVCLNFKVTSFSIMNIKSIKIYCIKKFQKYSYINYSCKTNGKSWLLWIENKTMKHLNLQSTHYSLMGN